MFLSSPAPPQESVAGMIAVLESERELQGAFHDYTGRPIPW